MRLVLVVVLAVICVAAGCSSKESAQSKFFEVAPAIAGQYIVVLPPEVPADAVPGVASELTTDYGGRLTHSYAAEQGELRGFAISGMSELRARALALDPRVKFVEQVARAFPAWKRTSPGWALDRIDQRDNTPSGVYRYSADGEGVRVYVLDSGINQTHPEFLFSNIKLGYDATATNGTGEDCDGHGTAMAGLIAGRTTGVAPAADIVNVKVLDCKLIGGNSAANIIAGLTWVTGHAIAPAVANLSLQLQYGSSDPAMRMAIADLVNRDVVVVVAAGNDNNDVAQVEPANYPGVLAVGGSLSSGSRWVNTGAPTNGCPTPPGGCGSNFGAALGIFAPASASTADYNGGYTIPPPGTSTAAAIVSGVAAATLQAFWSPLQPGHVYTTLPGEEVRGIILANATPNVVNDVRTSPNRFVFAEAWPISLGRFEVSSQGGLTSVASRDSSTAQTPSVAISGGYRNRFDETPTIDGGPYAAQVIDQQVPRWTQPYSVLGGGCGDVYDAGIAHLWVACTQKTAQGLKGVVKALSIYAGTPVGEVPVGLAAAGQTCAQDQKHSIARALRVGATSGVVYVVGEAWCGAGARTAFLAALDTQATTVLWEKRVFDQGTRSSAAYALTIDSGRITVAGSETLTNASTPTAHVAQFSMAGLPLGPGVDLATPGPSAAYSISADAASGDLYVAATREASTGAVGLVDAFTSGMAKLWEQSLDGAHADGVAALQDGVIVAGGTSRYLPVWPVTDQTSVALVGLPLPVERGFLMRFDGAGSLRWSRYVKGGPVVGIGLEGQTGGDTVLAHVVGVAPETPCPPPAPHCLRPPLVSFVESFRVQ